MVEKARTKGFVKSQNDASSNQSLLGPGFVLILLDGRWAPSPVAVHSLLHLGWVGITSTPA